MPGPHTHDSLTGNDPAHQPDPGSRATMLIALIAAVALFITTAVLQNQSENESEAPASTETVAAEPDASTHNTGARSATDDVIESIVAPAIDPTAGHIAEHAEKDSAGPDKGPSEGPSEGQNASPPPPAVAPPGADPFSLTAKLTLKLRELMRSDPNAIPTLDRYAVSDADQVRMVIVAAEFTDAAAARERITTLRAQLDGNDPLQDDLDLLAALYSADWADDTAPALDATTSHADALTFTDQQRARLAAHHGWFGEVALSAGLPDDHPERVRLLSGGIVAAIFLSVVGLGLVGAFLAGAALLVVGIIMLATGKLKARMPVPERGGSVYVETFAVFVAGFLAMKLGSEFLLSNNIGPPWLSMALQWSLVLTIFWPLLRGMSVARWKGTVGLHRGAGVRREIACGLLAYLAGLPLYAVAILLVLVLQLLKTLIMGDDGAAPPANPLLELVASAPWWLLLLLFTLATIWAPLVEEVVFRGGLFRTARSYFNVPVAAIVVGIVFAFMHNYGPLFTPPLIALGVVFAVMREWRGSLIAPIFAHFLHNATVMTLLLTMVHLLDL